MSSPRTSQREKKLLCEIIPTLNEAENIEPLVERFTSIRNQLAFELRLIIVDDNSKDGTAEKVEKLLKKYDNISLIRRPAATGLGSAYIDGFSYAMKNFKPEYFGEIDADLQHPPELLIEMTKIASAGTDVVIGSRYVPGGGAREWSFSRKLVSRGANILTRIFLNLPIKDSTSGFRVISRRAVESLFCYVVSSKGYSFQVESLYVYQKSGMTFAEVPFNFDVRRSGETKLKRKEIWIFLKTTVRTGIKGLKKS